MLAFALHVIRSEDVVIRCFGELQKRKIDPILRDFHNFRAAIPPPAAPNLGPNIERKNEYKITVKHICELLE